MTAYEVYFDKGLDGYYVRGLKGEDQRLLYHIPYPETETPEVADPRTAEAMHSALYDMYQWHDGLKEGDTFITPFGEFECYSFHVITKETADRIRSEKKS
jgi:hypothetical protein